MRLNLLYQFNEKYAPFAGTSIFSVFCNNREADEIFVYILGEGLSENSVAKMRRMAEAFHRNIEFLDAESLIVKMKLLNMPAYRGSYAANMRLFLDEILDDSIGRILYLDADTVVDASLSDLWQLDMGDAVIGMALDSLGESHKKQIGLKPDDMYFNSGVILFDLKKWKERDFSKKIAEHVANVRNNYPAPDQDLLNIVCKDGICRLDARYNFQPPHTVFTTGQYYRVMNSGGYYGREAVEAAAANVVIYHCFRFIGEFPWHRDNLHPYDAVFNGYMARSPWKDYRKARASVGAFIRIEKVLYKILPRFLFLVVFKYAHKLFLYKSNRDTLKNKINKTM